MEWKRYTERSALKTQTVSQVEIGHTRVHGWDRKSHWYVKSDGHVVFGFHFPRRVRTFPFAMLFVFYLDKRSKLSPALGCLVLPAIIPSAVLSGFFRIPVVRYMIRTWRIIFGNCTRAVGSRAIPTFGQQESILSRVL